MSQQSEQLEYLTKVPHYRPIVLPIRSVAQSKIFASGWWQRCAAMGSQVLK